MSEATNQCIKETLREQGNVLSPHVVAQCIDDLQADNAALRRAKAEWAREMIKIVKAHRADQRVADDLNNTVSFDSFNEVLDAITREIDARAAQIEEGE